MSYDGILSALVATWRPPIEVLLEHQRLSLESQLHELRSACAGRNWRTISMLAGQLVEALLKNRLRLIPKVRIPPDATMSTLVDMAIQHGLVADTTRSNAGALDSARVLRNWSVHLDFDAVSPTELRAAQAIALLICATETLFPTIGIASQTDAAEATPGLKRLFRRPGDAPPPTLIDELPAIARHAANISLSKQVAFARALRKHHLPTDAYAAAIVENFGLIVARAAHVNAKSLQEYIGVLKRCGLQDHARVFAVLLPIDRSGLIHLSGRSPAAGVRYLQASRSADRALFRKRIGLKMPQADATTFWRNLKSQPGGINNAAGLLMKIPEAPRATLLRTAPLNLLIQWQAEGSISRAVALLQACYRTVVAYDPHCIPIRRRFIDVLSRRVAAETLHHLESLIDLLRRRCLIEDIDVQGVILQLLARTTTAAQTKPEELSAARRIIWDAYSFVDCAQDTTVKAAAVLVAQDLAPHWDVLCLRGMLSLMDHESALAGVAGSPSLIIPSKADAWQKALVAAAAIRVYRMPPDSLPEELTSLPELPSEDSMRSAVLYKKARALVTGADRASPP